MAFVSTDETKSVSGIAKSAISVITGLMTIIMTRVPIKVIRLENSEEMDWEMVVDTFSTSFVMRLMMSPCRCVSV